MPPIRKLARLFEAVSDRDLESAEKIAKDIAALEEKKGHRSAAQLLRGSLQSNGFKGHRATEPLSGILSNGNFLEAALSRTHGSTRLKDVMLRPTSRVALQELVNETRHRNYLAAKRIRRRTKLLFVGPPGCGKSFTSQAIANELGLPHYVVRFDAVIGAYLGQTAIHLRELFRFASNQACILLFDEIDALGKQRGNPLDVGELDRIVIALMQELEFSDTQGLVIATSNLPQNLDRALWRRFDLILEFPTPGRRELAAYAKRVSDRFDLRRRLTPKTLNGARTYADAEKVIEAQARKIALAQAERG